MEIGHGPAQCARPAGGKGGVDKSTPAGLMSLKIKKIRELMSSLGLRSARRGGAADLNVPRIPPGLFT